MNADLNRARHMGCALALCCGAWGVSPSEAAGIPEEVPGDGAVRPWQHILINSDKAPTRYRRVVEGGAPLLVAEAEGSASLMMRPVRVDLARYPVLQWRWKLGDLPRNANNRESSKEDAAARLVFVFDGDSSKLPLKDRAVARVARALSGRNLPYATLMYVASNSAEVGSVIPNPYTRRVQMVVASKGQGGGDGWHALRRNLVQDYKRAFGEAPGALLAYGVMTDSDNTESRARAWYGPIRFRER